MPLADVPAELPGALADPLHFPGREGLGPWGWLALALLALGAAWLWWRRRRRSGRTAAAAAPRRSMRAPKLSAFERSIHRLEKETLDSGHYRQGCHDLATLLRRHFERAGLASGKHLPLTRLTAREIQAQTGDGALSRLLSHLAGLRFGRKHPDREEFRHACNRARRLAGGRHG